MKHHVLAGVALLGLLGPVTLAQAAGDPEKGREISEQHCSRCHVIGGFNKYGGINSTPSFQLLAKRDDWLERFSTFFERRPHPVFVRIPGVERWTKLPSHVAEFELKLEDVDDIVAFAETLRPK